MEARARPPQHRRVLLTLLPIVRGNSKNRPLKHAFTTLPHRLLPLLNAPLTSLNSPLTVQETFVF